MRKTFPEVFISMLSHSNVSEAAHLYSKQTLVCLYFTLVFSEKTYHGTKSAMMMFETVVGHSFKCVSEQSIQLSGDLQVKTINVQLQAFDFEDDLFGNGKLRVQRVTNINFRDLWVISSVFFV